MSTNIPEAALPGNYLDQLQRAWEAARPGTGNSDHDAAWERWAALTHQAWPALLADREPLSHGLSPRPEWAGVCPRCRALPGADCAILTTAAAADPAVLLRRLVAVVDAAGTFPIPADAFEAIHDAKEYLARQSSRILNNGVERERLATPDEEAGESGGVVLPEPDLELMDDMIGPAYPDKPVVIRKQ